MTELELAPLVAAALAAAPMLERFYLAGGGSARDLRTDLTTALRVALRAGAEQRERR